MTSSPSLRWNQILDGRIKPASEGDGKLWWHAGEDDLISLQVQSVNADDDDATLVSRNLIEIECPGKWLRVEEQVLRTSTLPGATHIGRLHIPFPGFTYVLEITCKEAAQGNPPPPEQRGRLWLDTVRHGLRIAPALRRYEQSPPLERDFTSNHRPIHRAVNDDATVQGLRALVGVQFQEIIASRMHYRISDRGLWLPHCSMPFHEKYLVVKSTPQVLGPNHLETGMLHLSVADRPYGVALPEDPMPEIGTPSRPHPSRITVEEESSPIEAIELYENHNISSFGDEEFLADTALIIRRVDGVEVSLAAYAHPHDLNFTIDPAAIASRRERFALRWDSRW